MSMGALVLSHLTVAYGSDIVVDDVSVSVPQGVMCAIGGPNGAGKTTIIRAALELVQPEAGTARFWGKPFRSVRSRIAYVPQRSGIDWDFPLSVLDVVVMGAYGRLGWFAWPGKREYAQARSVLSRVGMEPFADRPLRELSGGQRQRVFLARALMQEADLYIFDEPFVGIDAVTERIIVNILHQLRDDGKTVVIVHHDLHTMQAYFDWLVVLNTVLVAAGPVEDIFTRDVIAQAYGSVPSLIVPSS